MRIEYEILERDWPLYIPCRLNVGYCCYFGITIFVMLVRICESKIGAPDSLEVDLAAVKGLVDKAR